jgi:hypothetical protein
MPRKPDFGVIFHSRGYQRLIFGLRFVLLRRYM